VPGNQGAIRLFRLFGIDVWLHWSWFVVALYEVQGGGRRYSSLAWNVAEYLCLFLIVTIHEFGHSLACRQVGGTAENIVLWPLGGVAYVSPPQRPGAMLWSIAAGPLVNVALIPILFGTSLLAGALGLSRATSNLGQLIWTVAWINVVLLVFNVLPIYPLDGGKMFRSLLWFVLGRGPSLTVATVVGFLGVIGLVGLALVSHSPWTAILAVFMGMNCWAGFQQARLMAKAERLPRRQGFACPSCGGHPPQGALWICGQCRKRFDTFLERAVCPACGAAFPATSCADCGIASPVGEWERAGQPPREGSASVSSASS
jgi:Zn-dependent protease